MKDMHGQEIEVGDVVKVFSLIGTELKKYYMGKGEVHSLSGNPSNPEGLVWVKGLVSCHAPGACVIKRKGVKK